MFGYNYGESITVQSGRSGGRSVYDRLKKGTVRIHGTDENGRKFERIVQFNDGEIFDNVLKLDGKIVHHIAYGQFETRETAKGREITHFRPNTGKGLHGLARRWEKLFGHDGVCLSWYKRGRLSRQTFVYDNRRTAYDYQGFSQTCRVRDYDGQLLYEIKGVLDGRQNAFEGSHSVFAKERMADWFLQQAPFEVKERGKVVYSGQWKDRQKVGEWTERNTLSGFPAKFFYERGVAIPEKLFRTPPDKLNPVKILKLTNAQLRMALCEKIGPDRIAACGTVIHEDGEMRLYSIKGYDVNILRVQCPSTEAFYFLRVPSDTEKCEEARQWTFGVGDGINGPIKFAVET